jgi:3-phosphoshikimate 1-carboxyvinyltransferase
LKTSLTYKAVSDHPIITIPGSKSESNRLLILRGCYPNISITNLSNSDDTISLLKGIEQVDGIVDVHHAGTAMRFLTAYFASKKGVDIIIMGSKRMHERPIRILVDALNDLGADIHYLKNKGFPPLKIIGTDLNVSSVNLNAAVSSQYISALMLIAPSLKNGLTINLEGKITSIPYIDMTLDLLKKVGVSGTFSNNKIEIKHTKTVNSIAVNVESDWSSASYYFSIIALSNNLELTLNNFSKNSMQGDSKIISIFQKLGVETIFNKNNNSILLRHLKTKIIDCLSLNLNDTPDIAQTLAVTCFGLGIPCKLEGLKTLKIKETDRLLALKTELEKLGANVTITEESITVFRSRKIIENITIETYQDHRMAMAFAPLVLKVPINILEPNVVTKSYTTFWKDLLKIGVKAQLK